MSTAIYDRYSSGKIGSGISGRVNYAIEPARSNSKDLSYIEVTRLVQGRQRKTAVPKQRRGNLLACLYGISALPVIDQTIDQSSIYGVRKSWDQLSKGKTTPSSRNFTKITYSLVENNIAVSKDCKLGFNHFRIQRSPPAYLLEANHRIVNPEQSSRENIPPNLAATAGINKERRQLLRNKFLKQMTPTQSERLEELNKTLSGFYRRRLIQTRESSEYREREANLAIIRKLADALEKNLSHGDHPQKAKTSDL